MFAAKIKGIFFSQNFPIFFPIFSNSLRVSQDALDAGGCAAGDQRLPFGDLRLETRHGGGRNSGGAGRRWQTAADFLRSQVNKKLGVSENVASTTLNPMVLLILIPVKNGYFIGNIPYFQTNPTGEEKKDLDIAEGCWVFSKHEYSSRFLGNSAIFRGPEANPRTGRFKPRPLPVAMFLRETAR